MPISARILILLGLVLVTLGLLIVAFTRSVCICPSAGLPGDFSVRGRNWILSIPLATSLLLSALMTLLFWAFGRGPR